MMKKNCLLLSFLFLPAIIYAVELTSEQKNQARTVVFNYCILLSDFARSSSYINNIGSIQNLFSGMNTSVYDDLKNKNDILLTDYLTNITLDYNHSLTFSFENINTTTVVSIEAPSPDKSSRKVYAEIEVEKTIDGPGFKRKKVKNVFLVSLDNNKIYGVFQQNPSPGQTSSSLMYAGLKYYKTKQYENALACFKKAGEMGESEAMYYCGVMYFTNRGCNNERDENGRRLNQSKRDAKAYEWYRKAAQRGHEEARRQIVIFY